MCNYYEYCSLFGDTLVGYDVVMIAYITEFLCLIKKNML